MYTAGDKLAAQWRFFALYFVSSWEKLTLFILLFFMVE